MCACKFEALPYARVASLAMNKYKVFQKHDNTAWQASSTRCAPIAVGCSRTRCSRTMRFAELQWRRMHGCLSSG